MTLPQALWYGGVRVTRGGQQVELPTVLLLDYGNDTAKLEKDVNAGSAAFELPPQDETVAVVLAPQKES